MVTRILFVILLATASQATFTRGSEFNFVGLEGQLAFRCDNQRVVIDCRDTFMEPWPYDSFQGPIIPEATHIELRIESQNSTQVSVGNYDSTTGKSSEFNLGVYSLFSKPLLKIGQNKIRYTIFNQSNISLEQGSFEVRVNRLPVRTCPFKETSLDLSYDCDHVYSICQQYFKALNYCR